jgi:hypothetical protein
MKFKVGNTVRYKGYKTEYEILELNGMVCTLKLTKVDKRKWNNKTIIGMIFENCFIQNLELAPSSASRGHPLTSIFK